LRLPPPVRYDLQAANEHCVDAANVKLTRSLCIEWVFYEAGTYRDSAFRVFTGWSAASYGSI
jgi:hypothetical protein